MRWWVGAVVLAATLWSIDAHAIPPFARRYGFSCSTCHVGGPTKLSAFGEAFRDNGYRIPGDDASFVQQPPVPLGDPRRSMLFPGTLWPGEIPGYAPVGVSGTAGVTTTWPRDGGARTLAAEAEAKLLLGGSIGAHFSIFGVLEGGTDGLGLDQLHLVARSLLDRWIGEEVLNLKVGRFELDLFQFQPGLFRATGDAGIPLGMTLAVGQDGFSLAEPKEALEIYGLAAGRLKWVVGVANGQKPLDDVTTRRDFFARVSAKLGGLRLDYKNVTPDQSDTTTRGCA